MPSRLPAPDARRSRGSRARRAASAVALLGGGLGPVPWIAGCESDTTSYVPADRGDATVADAASANTAADAITDSTSEATGDATDGGPGAAPIDASVEAEAAPGNGDAAGIADAAVSDATQDSGTPPALAAVRVANWTDTPAVDFCLAVHGTGTFQGPMLSNLVDGGVAGLALTQDCATAAAALTATACPVSSYFLVRPLAYDLRFVAPLGDCSVPVFPDSTTLDALGGGTAVTLALLGTLHPSGSEPALKVVQLIDDLAVRADSVPLRFLHAAPALAATAVSLSIDVAMTGFQLLFSNVLFAQRNMQAVPGPDGGRPAIDPNGYVALSPFTAAVFSAQTPSVSVDSGAASQASSSSTSAAGGSVVTLALVNGATAPQLWECVDNAGTAGPYSNCFAISQ